MDDAVYYQTRQPAVYVVTSVLLVLATTAVILRFWARHISVARYWWDDFTIIVALVIAPRPYIQLPTFLLIATTAHKFIFRSSIMASLPPTGSKLLLEDLDAIPPPLVARLTKRCKSNLARYMTELTWAHGIDFSDKRSLDLYGHPSSLLHDLRDLQNISHPPLPSHLRHRTDVPPCFDIRRNHSRRLFCCVHFSGHLRMPSCRLLLEQIHTWWHMHRRDFILPLERCRQPPNRPDDSEPHLPNGLALEDRHQAKGDHKQYVRPRIIVRVPPCHRQNQRKASPVRSQRSSNLAQCLRRIRSPRDKLRAIPTRRHPIHRRRRRRLDRCRAIRRYRLRMSTLPAPSLWPHAHAHNGNREFGNLEQR